MSLAIYSNPQVVPPPQQVTQPPAAQTPVESVSQVPPQALTGAESPDLFRALDRMFTPRKEQGHRADKAFLKLAGSLQKAFSDAPRVDHHEGEEEMHKSGLKRVGKDLKRLFKGLGMPGDLARQFAHQMTDALRQGGTEQVSLSLTATRAFSLEMQQTQASYLADGSGNGAAAAVANSFSLTAIQVRSFDVSINLGTGELSMARTRFDALSVSSSSAALLASRSPAPAAVSAPDGSYQPPTQDVVNQPSSVDSGSSAGQPAAPANPVAQAPTNDVSSLIEADAQLLEIRRLVQQSTLLQLQPTSSADDRNDEQVSFGMDFMREMTEHFEQTLASVKDLFENITRIHNLRVEEEDDDHHLRFTLDAQAPIGLSATDDAGRKASLYVRPDGNLAKTGDTAVQITA